MVISLFENENFHISKRIAVYGCLKKSNTDQLILDSFKSHTDHVFEIHESNLTVSNAVKYPSIDIDDEISACVSFIKNHLAKKPDAKICITSPILTDIKEKLTYALLSEISTLTNEIDNIAHTSFGEPFYDIPEIQTLLSLLEFESGKDLEPQIIDYIELSGSICDRLPERSGSIFTCDIETLERCGFHCEIVREITTYYQWCQGDNDRHEQIKAKLEEIFGILESSDLTNQKVSFNTFLFKFKEIVKSTPFKLLNKGSHNLYIFGIYETIGLNFDHIWVLGTNGNYWPNRVKPNPLIARHISDSYNLILKDSEETEFFSEITKRLTQSCYELYYSYSKFSQDRELIEPTFFKSENTLHLQKESRPFLPCKKIPIEYIDDTYTAEIGYGQKCPRGTQYIKNFVGCPFKAHYTAKYECIKAEIALSFVENKTHGDLVHHSLEALSKIYPSSESIRQHSDEILFENINSSIEGAIAQYKNNTTLPDWYFRNEQSRICTLLQAFFALEKTRNFTIVDIEKMVQLHLGGMKFTLFIDRIEDESLSIDGEMKVLRIVSDHKTGRENASEWFKVPCPEPQIPMYTLLEGTQGAIYNIIRDDEVAYKGFIKDGLGSAMGLSNRTFKSDWNSQIENWREQLDSFAIGIREGYSIPSPLDEKTCEYCVLKRSCRK